MAYESLDVHRMRGHLVDERLIHTGTGLATRIAVLWGG